MGGSDAAAGTATAPWRTLSHAVSAAPQGSTIRVGSGTYAPVSIKRGNLTIEAEPGATVTVSGGLSAIVVSAAHVTIRDIRVTGATSQGVWIDGASDVVLDGLTVSRNIGHGVQIIRSARVHITNSSFVGNRMGGIRELDGTTDDRYVANTITDNGHDGQPYNGDGLLLQGSGAYVASNTISRNGDSATFEHGIYAAAIARGYVIVDNVLKDNAASGIKGSGSGTIKRNVISGSVRGIVFADDGGTVQVTGNSIGATTYAIAVTSNCVLGRYESDYNVFLSTTFGYGGPIDFATWKSRTGLDLHSS